ncbi:MAG: hypothetical protein ACXW31_01595 [Thermoanaerobaculia bacterium]
MQRENSMKAIAPVLDHPRDPGLLLVGFKAWSGPQPDSEPALREQLDAMSTRAVWDLDRGRIAFTVNEHRSVEDALNALADELEANQLADVPRGPEDLGEISFVHPPNAPPAVFFVRGNLTLAVYSFGREPVDVVPFARRVDAELRARPADAREGGVDVQRGKLGILVKPKYAGEGYLKVFAPLAKVHRTGEEIVIDGPDDGVDIYYVERGREPQRATAGRGTL